MRTQTEQERQLEDFIYGLRLLVVLECGQGHFHQVGLTRAMFKRVSDACVVKMHSRKPNGDHEALLHLHPKKIPPKGFDNMRTHYDPEELAEFGADVV